MIFSGVVPALAGGSDSLGRRAAMGHLCHREAGWGHGGREYAAAGDVVVDGRAGGQALPGVGQVRRLHPPKGRGMLFSRVLPVLERAPLVRANLLSVWSARF